MAFMARTLLPASLTRGEKAAIARSPGATAAEPRPIELAYAFEKTTRARKPPSSSP